MTYVRYVYPSEIDTFGGVKQRQDYFSSGPIGRSWAANYTTASRLPLHLSLGPPNTPYPPAQPVHFESEVASDQHYNPLSHAALSFVHGGLSPTYQDLTPFPSRINELSESFLAKLQNRVQPPPHPPHNYPGLPRGTTQAEAAMYDANGPVWYRGWAMEDEETVCGQVDDVLKRTGTRRMIMGHTPDFTVRPYSLMKLGNLLNLTQGIVARCDGKIIIIDTVRPLKSNPVDKSGLTWPTHRESRMHTAVFCPPCRYITRLPPPVKITNKHGSNERLLVRCIRIDARSLLIKSGRLWGISRCNLIRSVL